MSVNDAVRIHLASLDAGHASFKDSLALIEEHFEYQPCGFRNGPLVNAEGENAGSGESHGNIRQFISTGWSGIRFEGVPLRQRPNPTDNMTREETPS